MTSSQLCRAERPMPRDAMPHTRIVRCGQQAGHAGVHVETGTEVSWANVRPPRRDLAEVPPSGLPESLRGDGPCWDCGTPDNIRWWTDSALWNRVMGGPDARDDPGGIVCVSCFVARVAAAGLAVPAWRLMPEAVNTGE